MEMLMQMASVVEQLATPWQFTYANEQLRTIGDAVGFPVDQLRCVACFLLAYPLAAMLNLLRSHKLKHWANFGVGLAMAQFVYGQGWIHSFTSASVTYALLHVLPMRIAPYVIFVANMAFVASLHLYRMHVDYMGWSMDSTASQMLLLIKLTSFSFNYYDGHVPSMTNVLPTDPPRVVKQKQLRARLSIQEMPTLLEFFGFVYCFTTFLAGPAIEFQEYMDAIRGSKFNEAKQKRRPVSSVGPAFSKFATGALFMAMMAFFGHLSDLRIILKSKDHIAVRCGRLMVALFLTRAKYYCAWKLSEGATVLFGAGFEGFDEDGNPKGWNGVSNIDIAGFEFGESTRDISRAWNKGTQHWLERYVYSRTANSVIATYLCSAIWHGFYPGYYLFFLSLPLATSVNRLAYKYLRPHFLTKEGKTTTFYNLMSLLCTCLIINYLAVSFVLLSWEESLAAYQSMGFIGHFALIAAYGALTLLANNSSKKAGKQA